jgi:putative oxidoreductase
MSDQAHGFAAFLLRIVLGICFTLHGCGKVFGLFGGQGLDKWIDTYAAVGIGPSWLGYLVAFGELLGGIALILGTLHRAAAFTIAVIMAGAIWTVHGKNGYFLKNQGFEYPLALLAIAIAVMLIGPGLWAFELNRKRKS